MLVDDTNAYNYIKHEKKITCNSRAESTKLPLKRLTEETFKCLLFVCGLKDEQDAEVRVGLLCRLEDRDDTTLPQLTETCQKLVNLKHETAMIKRERKINAIAQDRTQRVTPKWKNYRKPDRPQDKSKASCFTCGEGHLAKRCTVWEIWP